MMLTTRASRDSDADEFHDALEHLEEEEEEENEHVVAAKEDAATATVDTDEVDTDAAIGEDNKPSMLQSHASEEESSTSITHPAADEKTSANPPQPPSREVTEESWQSARSVTNSLHREGSTEERISLDTQPSVDLLGIASKSLFDALSGSGSEELENAELTHHTLWNTLDKSSAGIDNIETQDSAEKQVQQSIDDDAKDTDDRTDSESNSDGSSSENDDAATNDDVEEGEQEQTGQLLPGGGIDDVQNHEPDAKNSEVNEDCRDTTGNTVSMEEEEERQVSINGVSKDKGEEQNQMDAAEGKVEEEEEEDVEEETTKATISTTESSFDTPTKEVQAPQLEEKKAIIDESSEQVLEVAKGDERELGDEPAPTPAKRGSETTAQEQVVTDGDYITPRKIDCGELCDMGSPLEALFLFCQGRRSGLDIDTTKEDIDIPLRTSSFTDADPRAPAPLSPVDDHQHDYDSDSSDDSSIDSVVKFKMVNKDIDSIHDVRNIMRDIDDKGSSDAIDTQYSILPDRETLEYHQRLSAGPNEMNQMASHSFDESLSTLSHRSTSGSPTSARKKASEFKQKLKRGVAGLRSSKKHHRKRIVSSEELPGNAVYVRSSMAKTAQMRLKTSSSEESPTLNSADSSFNPMLLVKTIQAHDGPAWCAAFSNDGSFLATGGEDGNVTIWAVSPKSKKLHPKGVPTRGGENQNEDENNEEEQAPPLSFVGLGPELATNLEIISSEPVQRYRDHTADVIDLSWSHTNFLLTASVDKSVRLYHFSKSNCLHLFKHANLVASVDFHPLDDRYFISGGLDKKLRLWNITDGRVKDWAQAPEVITSTRFTPDGKYAVAGLLRGQVYLYEADGLKYYTQIACRNRSGKNRKGKKVTGISFLREVDDKSERSEEHHPSLTERLSETGRSVANLVATKVLGNPEALSTRRTDRMLVSTNDSRVRLYGLNDFCMIRKYKGHTNNSMQIRARVSESGSHIACGSESGHCFIWDVDPNKNRLKKNMINKQIQSTKDKSKSTDYFEASKASLPIVTDTLFFPTKTVRESLLTSKEVFPLSLGMDRIDDDFSSAAILTLDYDGTIRVFVRKTCIDNILEACTPRGGTMA
mmetsp:Transcript_12923/g.26056  ORF Transcript_12923/g.26056 Transcript_12923/m.26056 type:complete len:1099 (+) Transcript_12923:86-3382(+)